VIVSAGANKNHETATANFLNILAESNPANESIQIAPDPSGGAWEKLIPKIEVNYSTILISLIQILFLNGSYQTEIT
jgi:hypothetical protein